MPPLVFAVPFPLVLVRIALKVCAPSYVASGRDKVKAHGETGAGCAPVPMSFRKSSSGFDEVAEWLPGSEIT
jgi:hypothetical protein